jgi:hypothetical protein
MSALQFSFRPWTAFAARLESQLRRLGRSSMAHDLILRAMFA